MRTKNTYEVATTNPVKALRLLILSIHSGTYAWIETRPKGQREIPFKVDNPALDDEENWIEFHERLTTWEEILDREDKFFNETQRRLTLSKDTADDPQYYTFYKPKEGIPYQIDKPKECRLYFVCSNRKRKSLPLWAKMIRVVTYPAHLVPKKNVKKMSKRTCYSLRVGSTSNGISLEFHIPKKFSLK